MKGSNFFVLITGSMRTGKSTLAQKLAKQFPHNIIIRRDDIKDWISMFGETSYQEEIIWNIALASAKIALNYGYNVILEGPVQHKSVFSIARKIAKTNNAKLFIIRLVCPFNIQYKREIKYKQCFKADFSATIKKLRVCRPLGAITINTHHITRDATAKKIINKILKSYNIK